MGAGMPDTPELREQLRSLSIPREQRPGGQATPKKRGSRSLAIFLLFVAVLALGGFVAWERFGPQLRPLLSRTAPTAPLRLLTVSASRTDTTPVLTATGKIVSDHRVAVATKVSGQVVALHFEQGDRVARGQILAEIEDEAYRARRDEAAANLVRARANLEYQKFNFERVERLFEEQQASDIEYAEVRRAAAEAEAQVAAYEATLAFTEKLLRDCRVEAPIAGVILERSVEVGDFVAAEGGRGAMANSQFAAIADMTKLRVEVDISELDIGRLRTGMPCLVIPDAQKERRYHGHVLWIDPGANYAKATVQVKVRIEDPDEGLRVEGAAQVQFLGSAPEATATTQAAAGLWIPLSACRADASGRNGRVFVVHAGRLRETRVTLGRHSADRVEVLDGLTEGQQIVADGLDQLRDGQSVSR